VGLFCVCLFVCVRVGVGECVVGVVCCVCGCVYVCACVCVHVGVCVCVRVGVCVCVWCVQKI